MTANADEAGVITTQSGLQYKVLEEGEGDSTTADDVALINYTGLLPEGAVFDQNERAPLPVDGVGPGFSKGRQLVTRGGQYRLWIPPQLGLGSEVHEGGVHPQDR